MTAVSRDRQSTRPVYVVKRLSDGDEIRRLLEGDRAYSAYALAQLDPQLFGRAEWYVAEDGGRRALLMHTHSGLGNATFATGDAPALDVALSLHPGPRFTFGSFRLEHRAVFDKHFILGRPQKMLRLSVTADSFTPVAGAPERLDGRDVPAINRLYSTEGGPTSYRPAHVEEGAYYGVREGGALVSIAGTHVVSRREGVGVVGNVFTHPRHRDHQLATIATSAVTADLLKDCSLVALTVEEQNEPALRVYRRLGYKTECELHETPLIRKEPTGALSFLRRTAASWRGRREGKEMVIR